MGSISNVFRRITSKSCFQARLSTTTLSFNTNNNELKRPPSPFALFFQEQSKNLKFENPSLNQKEIMKLASDMWKGSGSYEQQKYRDIYDDRFSSYKQSVKAPPKRPVNPYIRFYMENSDTLSVIYPNVVDRTKKTGEMWQSLSEYEKSKYKKEFDREMETFIENLTEEDKEAIQNRRETLSLQRERRNIRKYGKTAWKEKPKVGSANSYIAYIREHRSEVPKGENPFIFLSKGWKELNESQKMVYQEKANENLKIEREKLQEWEEKNNVSS